MACTWSDLHGVDKSQNKLFGYDKICPSDAISCVQNDSKINGAGTWGRAWNERHVLSQLQNIDWKEKLQGLCKAREDEGLSYLA